MRVCFLLPGQSPSGGVAVVLGHARRLADHGVRAEVLWTDGDGPRQVDGVAARPLAEATAEPWDVAVATWWTTALALPRVRARRRLVFAQSVDARFYGREEAADRLGASVAPALGDGLLAVGEGLARSLRALHPDLDVAVVRNGVDKDVFSPRERPRGERLRILVEGAPGLAVKGVGEALAAVRAMREPAAVTVVSLAPPPEGIAADRTEHGLDAAGMAALYGEHDVLLKLSRHEGLSLPCLEAMHTGLPCVVTPFGGHEDFLRHGHNGLLVGFDDTAGTARALDRLAREPDVLAPLGRGALETAARWPSPTESTAVLAATLTAPPREPGDGRRAAAAALAGHLELLREQLRRDIDVRNEARQYERDMRHYRHENEKRLVEVHDLEAVVRGLQDLVVELNESRDYQTARLEEVLASRAYRFVIGVRRLVRRGR